MKKIKSLSLKCRVDLIDEDNIVYLSCGIHMPYSALDFDVEQGKEYEFTLTGDGLHESYIVLSSWVIKVEYEEDNT